MVPGLQARMRWDVLLRGYLESIEQVDQKIARLVEILTRHGRFERTLVVVTADHGQSFGEMGNAYHGTGATDSVTRVPLVVSAPSGLDVPRRVERWVSLTEVHNWILSAARGQPPYERDAGSVAADESIDGARVVFSECAPIGDVNRSMRSVGLDQLWNHRLVAAYRGRDKYMLDLVTGEIWAWAGEGDPDREPGRHPDALEAERIRSEIFQPYAKRAGTVPPGAATSSGQGEIEIDQRLKSWGYD